MAILEICANSYQSAINAEKGGAHRIELCQNLEAGGITPSIGLIARVKQKLTIPVYILIRPRTGDFAYTDDEFDVMLEDIRICRDLAVDGITVGVLTRDGCVDIQRTTRLVEAAKPMPVTFHRAFDDCPDLLQALEDVIRTGCARILTSGGADSAIQGSVMLAKLVKYAQERIVIMPGAGITTQNLNTLALSIGAVEFHASAKTSTESIVQSRFAVPQLQTDVNQVKTLVEILAEL